MLLPLLVALAATAPDAGSPQVVEEVVAVLRNPVGAPPRAITLTRLTEEARIVLVSRGAADAAFRPIDGPALRATLEWLIDQTLLADEAARLTLADVGGDQVAAELVRFQARFATPAAYTRFLAASELAEEEVAAVLARMLGVDRYLDTRLGRGAAVPDDEVQAYLLQHGLGEGSRATREAARARLAAARLDGQVRALVAELRGHADVRILDPGLVPAEQAAGRGG